MKRIVLAVSIFILICGLSANAADVRTWTSGSTKMEAELVEVSDDGLSVKLRRSSDDKVGTVLIEKLSKEDQEYVKNYVKSKSDTSDYVTSLGIPMIALSKIREAKYDYGTQLSYPTGSSQYNAIKRMVQEGEGFLVLDVIKDLPAYRAGISKGDIITHFDSNQFETMEAYQEWRKKSTAASTQLTYRKFEPYGRDNNYRFAPAKEITIPFLTKSEYQKVLRDNFEAGVKAKVEARKLKTTLEAQKQVQSGK